MRRCAQGATPAVPSTCITTWLAVLFVLFDLEAVFNLSLAVSLRFVGDPALVEMFVLSPFYSWWVMCMRGRRGCSNGSKRGFCVSQVELPTKVMGVAVTVARDIALPVQLERVLASGAVSPLAPALTDCLLRYRDDGSWRLPL